MNASRVREAVVVAAGESTRLSPLSLELPKPLFVVDGHEPMLTRTVSALERCGIERISVVVGYQHQKIRSALRGRVSYILNPFYSLCNNMGSLWFAHTVVRDKDFLYLHGDLIYDATLLNAVLHKTSEPTVRLLVDFGPADAEAMKVRVEKGRFVESSKKIPPSATAGEWIGIASFTGGASRLLFDEIEALLLKGEFDAYDTAAFNRLAETSVKFELCSAGDGAWMEIDDYDDLESARKIFQKG